MTKIICPKCKSTEEIEGHPPSAESVLCSDCRVAGDPDEQSETESTSIPAKEHGTRVMLPITCAECGERDTLDYVPKGADLDEVLCSDCAREEFGTDSDWARIEQAKQQQSDDREWEFECDACGRTDVLPFEPKPDRHYECNLCRLDHETPDRDRLSGREKAAGGVFIRRGGDDEDGES